MRRFSVIFLLCCMLFAAGAATDSAAFGLKKRHPHWKRGQPIEFVVNVSNAPSTFSEDQLLMFVNRALETWANVDTADLDFRLGGTIDEPDKNEAMADGVNVIFWEARDAPRTDNVSGRAHPFASECDIQMLPMSPYTLRDVQAIILHEIGHCIGLAHSAADGVMTKFQGLPLLSRDDVVGASILHPHPTRTLKRSSAMIKGRVLYHGKPLIGAVLRALDYRTQRVVIAGFSGLVDRQLKKDSSGRFELPGLPPGRYKLSVAPMDVFVSADPAGYGAPVANPTKAFQPLVVDIPELEAGDVYNVGSLKVTDR